jgi:hypothetical protein
LVFARYSWELKQLQYGAVTRAAEGQRAEDDEALALLRKHSPDTPVTKDQLVWALNMVGLYTS